MDGARKYLAKGKMRWPALFVTTDAEKLNETC